MYIMVMKNKIPKIVYDAMMMIVVSVDPGAVPDSPSALTLVIQRRNKTQMVHTTLFDTVISCVYQTR